MVSRVIRASHRPRVLRLRGVLVRAGAWESQPRLLEPRECLACLARRSTACLQDDGCVLVSGFSQIQTFLGFRYQAAPEDVGFKHGIRRVA